MTEPGFEMLLPGAAAGRPEALRQLEEAIRQLLHRDFPALVNLLYRFDVPEQRLKEALAAQPDTDAASIMAALVIKRYREKAEARKNYSRGSGDIPDDEKW